MQVNRQIQGFHGTLPELAANASRARRSFQDVGREVVAKQPTPETEVAQPPVAQVVEGEFLGRRASSDGGFGGSWRGSNNNTPQPGAIVRAIAAYQANSPTASRAASGRAANQASIDTYA
jgi:hypothetical protein